MNALLIEEHPLLRLGLLQMLETIQEFEYVVAMEPADVVRLDVPPRNAELLVFGMPADAAMGWAQLELAREHLSPQRILMLAEALPVHVPTADAARGICGCLPMSASLAVIEAAIRLVISSVQGLTFAGAIGTTPSASRSAMPAAQSLSSAAQDPLAHGACARTLRATVAVHDLTSLRPGQPMSLPVTAARPPAGEEPNYDEAEMLQITPRQYEVLVLLARGYPIKTVSRMLNISVATVKSHACTLYARLKVRNKGEAVYAALQRGATFEWVSGDEPSARNQAARRDETLYPSGVTSATL